MIVDNIKKANIEAMKAKDMTARAIYGVVLNKIMLENIKKREKGEQLVDADVVQILQKSLKELDDELENYVKVNNLNEIENIKKQKGLIENFVPQMISKEEIKKLILALEDKSIGNVMKFFKTNYAGKCDMRDVNLVLKEI